MRAREQGIVWLVGAGPGDPQLITVKGLDCLRRADVVVYDRLVPRRLIDEAPACARRIDVGKAPAHHPWPQYRINALLVAEARRGRKVVRLKGGDPFVFGRGGEECHVLAEAGIRYEVVPGVTSAVAAPAYAGIPVTHRDHSSAFAVVTGHTADSDFSAIDWSALARVGTLVILMGLSRIRTIVTELRAHGLAADTPVAVIGKGTTAEQHVVHGTLDDIAARTTNLESPATIVVGAVAALAGRLAWFTPESTSAQPDSRRAPRAGIVA